MLTYVLLILFLVCALLLILLILIQKGRGAGLAGAFGGGGGQSAFGTKTADILTKATAVLTAVFFLLALVSDWHINRQAFGGGSGAPVQKAPSQPDDASGDGETPAAPTGDTGAAPADGGATAPAGGDASSNGGADSTPATDGGDN